MSRRYFNHGVWILVLISVLLCANIHQVFSAEAPVASVSTPTPSAVPTPAVPASAPAAAQTEAQAETSKPAKLSFEEALKKIKELSAAPAPAPAQKKAMKFTASPKRPAEADGTTPAEKVATRQQAEDRMKKAKEQKKVVQKPKKASKAHPKFRQHNVHNMGDNNPVPVNNHYSASDFSSCQLCIDWGYYYCASTWQCVDSSDYCPESETYTSDSGCPVGIELVIKPDSIRLVNTEIHNNTGNGSAALNHYKASVIYYQNPEPVYGASTTRSIPVRWTVLNRVFQQDTPLYVEDQLANLTYWTWLTLDFSVEIPFAWRAQELVVQLSIDPDNTLSDFNPTDNIQELIIQRPRIFRVANGLAGTFLHGMNILNKVFVQVSEPLRDDDYFQVYLDGSVSSILTVSAKQSYDPSPNICNEEMAALASWWPIEGYVDTPYEVSYIYRSGSPTIYSFYLDMSKFIERPTSDPYGEGQHRYTVRLFNGIASYIDEQTVPVYFRTNWLYAQAFNARYSDLSSRYDNAEYRDINDYVIRTNPDKCPSYWTVKVPLRFPLGAGNWNSSQTYASNNPYLSNLTDHQSAFSLRSGFNWYYSSVAVTDNERHHDEHEWREPHQFWVDDDEGSFIVKILGASTSASVKVKQYLEENNDWLLNFTRHEINVGGQGEWPINIETGGSWLGVGKIQLTFPVYFGDYFDVFATPATSGAVTQPEQLFDFAPEQPVQRAWAQLFGSSRFAGGARSFVRPGITASGWTWSDFVTQAGQSGLIYGVGGEFSIIGQWTVFGLPVEEIDFNFYGCWPAANYYANNCSATLDPTTETSGSPYIEPHMRVFNAHERQKKIMKDIKKELKTHMSTMSTKSTKRQAHTDAAQSKPTSSIAHDYIIQSLDPSDLDPFDTYTADLERLLWNSDRIESVAFSHTFEQYYNGNGWNYPQSYNRLSATSSCDTSDLPETAPDNCFTFLAYEAILRQYDGDYLDNYWNQEQSSQVLYGVYYSPSGLDYSANWKATQYIQNQNLYHDSYGYDSGWSRCAFWPSITNVDSPQNGYFNGYNAIVYSFTSVDCLMNNGSVSTVDYSTADIIVMFAAAGGGLASEIVFNTFMDSTSNQANGEQDGRDTYPFLQNTPLTHVEDSSQMTNKFDGMSVTANCPYDIVNPAPYGQQGHASFMTVWIRDADADVTSINDQTFWFSSHSLNLDTSNSPKVVNTDAAQIPGTSSLGTDQRLVLTCTGGTYVLAITNAAHIADTAAQTYVGTFDRASATWSAFVPLDGTTGHRSPNIGVVDATNVVFGWIGNDKVWSKSYDLTTSISTLTGNSRWLLSDADPNLASANTKVQDLSLVKTDFGVVFVWLRPGFFVASNWDFNSDSFSPFRVVTIPDGGSISDFTVVRGGGSVPHAMDQYIRIVYNQQTNSDGNYWDDYGYAQETATQMKVADIQFWAEVSVTNIWVNGLPQSELHWPDFGGDYNVHDSQLQVQVEITNTGNLATVSGSVTLQEVYHLHQGPSNPLWGNSVRFPALAVGEKVVLNSVREINQNEYIEWKGYVATAYTDSVPPVYAYYPFGESSSWSAFWVPPNLVIVDPNVWWNNRQVVPGTIEFYDVEQLYIQVNNNGPVRVDFYLRVSWHDGEHWHHYNIGDNEIRVAGFDYQQVNWRLSDIGLSQDRLNRYDTPITMVATVYYSSYADWDLSAINVQPISTTRTFGYTWQSFLRAQLGLVQVYESDSVLVDIVVPVWYEGFYSNYDSFQLTVTDVTTGLVVATPTFGWDYPYPGFRSFEFTIAQTIPAGSYWWNITVGSSGGNSNSPDDDWNYWDNSFLLEVNVVGVPQVQFDANSTIYVASSNALNVYLANVGNADSIALPVSILLYDNSNVAAWDDNYGMDWDGVVVGKGRVESMPAGSCSIVSVPVVKEQSAELAKRLLQWKFYLDSTLCLVVGEYYDGNWVNHVRNCFPLSWLRLNQPKPCLTQNSDVYLGLTRTSPTGVPAAHVLLNEVGTYNLQLQADGVCASSVVQRTIQLRCAGSPPANVLTVDKTSLVLGDHALLNASGSWDIDVDDTVLSYSWYFTAVPDGSSQRTGWWPGVAPLISPHYSVGGGLRTFNPLQLDSATSRSEDGGYHYCFLLTGRPIEVDGMVDHFNFFNTWYWYAAVGTYRNINGVWQLMGSVVFENYYPVSNACDDQGNGVTDACTSYTIDPAYQWAVQAGDVFGFCTLWDFEVPFTYHTTSEEAGYYNTPDPSVETQVFASWTDAGDMLQTLNPQVLVSDYNFLGSTLNSYAIERYRYWDASISINTRPPQALPNFPVVYFTPDLAGDYSLTYRVSDGCHDVEQSVDFTVLCPSTFIARISYVEDAWYYQNGNSENVYSQFHGVDLDASSTPLFDTPLGPTVADGADESLSTVSNFQFLPIQYEWSLTHLQSSRLPADAPPFVLPDGTTVQPDFIGIRPLDLDWSYTRNGEVGQPSQGPKLYECYASVTVPPPAYTHVLNETSGPTNLSPPLTTTAAGDWSPVFSTQRWGDSNEYITKPWTTQYVVTQVAQKTTTTTTEQRTISTYQNEAAQELSYSLGVIRVDNPFTSNAYVSLFNNDDSYPTESRFHYNGWPRGHIYNYTHPLCHGVYTVQLTASNPCHSSTSTATFRTQCPPPPTAVVACARTVLSGSGKHMGWDGAYPIRWADYNEGDSYPFEHVTIDGSGSSSPWGNNLLYYWSVSGPLGELRWSSQRTTDSPFFRDQSITFLTTESQIQLLPLQAGTYTITLIVSDGCTNHTDTTWVHAVCRNVSGALIPDPITTYFSFTQDDGNDGQYTFYTLNFTSIQEDLPVFVNGFGNYSRLDSGRLAIDTHRGAEVSDEWRTVNEAFQSPVQKILTRWTLVQGPSDIYSDWIYWGYSDDTTRIPDGDGNKYQIITFVPPVASDQSSNYWIIQVTATDGCNTKSWNQSVTVHCAPIVVAWNRTTTTIDIDQVVNQHIGSTQVLSAISDTWNVTSYNTNNNYGFEHHHFDVSSTQYNVPADSPITRWDKNGNLNNWGWTWWSTTWYEAYEKIGWSPSNWLPAVYSGYTTADYRPYWGGAYNVTYYIGDDCTSELSVTQQFNIFCDQDVTGGQVFRVNNQAKTSLYTLTSSTTPQADDQGPDGNGCTSDNYYYPCGEFLTGAIRSTFTLPVYNNGFESYYLEFRPDVTFNSNSYAWYGYDPNWNYLGSWGAGNNATSFSVNGPGTTTYIFNWLSHCNFHQYTLEVVANCGTWSLEFFDSTPTAVPSAQFTINVAGDHFPSTIINVAQGTGDTTTHNIWYSEWYIASAPAGSKFQSYVGGIANGNYFYNTDGGQIQLNPGNPQWGGWYYWNTFDQEGTYIVTVKAWDYCGENNFLTKNVTIIVSCQGAAVNMGDAYVSGTRVVPNTPLAVTASTPDGYQAWNLSVAAYLTASVSTSGWTPAQQYPGLQWRFKVLTQPEPSFLLTQLFNWDWEEYQPTLSWDVGTGDGIGLYTGYTEPLSIPYADGTYTYLPGTYTIRAEVDYGLYQAQGGDAQYYNNGGCAGNHKDFQFTVGCTSVNTQLTFNASASYPDEQQTAHQVLIGNFGTDIKLFGRVQYYGSGWCNQPSYSIQGHINMTHLYGDRQDNILGAVFLVNNGDAGGTFDSLTGIDEQLRRSVDSPSGEYDRFYTYWPDQVGQTQVQYTVLDQCYNTRSINIWINTACPPLTLTPTHVVQPWRKQEFAKSELTITPSFATLTTDEANAAIAGLTYTWSLVSAPADSKYSLTAPAGCTVVQRIDTYADNPDNEDSDDVWLVIVKTCPGNQVTSQRVIRHNNYWATTQYFWPDVKGQFIFQVSAVSANCGFNCPATTQNVIIDAVCNPITANVVTSSFTVGLDASYQRFGEVTFDASNSQYSGDWSDLTFYYLVDTVPGASAYPNTSDWSGPATTTTSTGAQLFRLPGSSDATIISSAFTTTTWTDYHSWSTLANPNGARACFAPDVPGTFEFELRVTDHCPGQSPPYQSVEGLSVTANCDNQPTFTNTTGQINEVSMVPNQFNRFDLSQYIQLDPTWNPALVQWYWSVQAVPFYSSAAILSQVYSRDAFFSPDVAGEYVFNVQIWTACWTSTLTVTVLASCPGTDAVAVTQVVGGLDVIRWSQTRVSAQGTSNFDAVAPADATTVAVQDIPSVGAAKLNGGGLKAGSGSVPKTSDNGGTDSTSGSSGLSTGAIIAIAVSLGVIGAIALVLGIVYCMKATSLAKVSSTQ